MGIRGKGDKEKGGAGGAGEEGEAGGQGDNFFLLPSSFLVASASCPLPSASCLLLITVILNHLNTFVLRLLDGVIFRKLLYVFGRLLLRVQEKLLEHNHKLQF